MTMTTIVMVSMTTMVMRMMMMIKVVMMTVVLYIPYHIGCFATIKMTMTSRCEKISFSIINP